MIDERKLAAGAIAGDAWPTQTEPDAYHRMFEEADFLTPNASLSPRARRSCAASGIATQD